MEDVKKQMLHPDSPSDGPQDGVMFKTDCIRTDFVENPKEGEALFQQQAKSEASITASVMLGIFSIRDRESNTMLTVAFDDALEVLYEAIGLSKEVGTWPEKILESAETAEEESGS